jgi:cell division protein ZapA
MKQLEVQIMGQSYLLGCPEGGDSRLLEAVERVDTAMCKIREAGKVRARDRIAVLAALNLAFDLAERENAKPEATTPKVPQHLGADDPPSRAPRRARTAANVFAGAAGRSAQRRLPDIALFGLRREGPVASKPCQFFWPVRVYNPLRLRCSPGFIFLEPMLIEPGLGTSLLKRDHLASDGPNVQLTSPT